MCGRRGCVTFISHHPGSYFSSILLKRESNIPIIVESSFTEWLKMVLGIKEKFRVIVQLFIFLLKLRINSKCILKVSLKTCCRRQVPLFSLEWICHRTVVVALSPPTPVKGPFLGKLFTSLQKVTFNIQIALIYEPPTHHLQDVEIYLVIQKLIRINFELTQMTEDWQ